MSLSVAVDCTLWGAAGVKNAKLNGNLGRFSSHVISKTRF